MKFTKNLLFVFMIIGLIACKKDDNSSNTNSPVNQNPEYADPQLSGNLVTADFDGRVTDKEGQPIANALIQIGNKSTSTNDYGYYRIENAQVDEKFALVQVTGGNNFKQFRNFIPRTNSINRQDIVMISRDVAGVYETADGGEVSLPGGAKATFMPGSLVQEDGSAFSGQVIVAASYLNPTDPTIGSYLPGSLAAVNEEGEQQALITFGMLGIELLTSNGAPLQLADGQTAELEFPIQPEQNNVAPETIPLWFFDEISGIWREEGMATKVGDRYVGEVSHFTFWNVDIPDAFVFVEGSVVFENSGNPISGSVVHAELSDGGSSTAVTNSMGEFSGFFPANEVISLSCQVYNGCELVSFPAGTVGPFNNNDEVDLGVFEIEEPDLNADYVNISATLVDCEGEPINNYFINYFSPELISGYYSLSGSGEFEATFVSCIGNFELSIAAFDWDNPGNLYTAEVVVPVELEQLHLGEIVICDETITADEEYFTYQDDSTSFVWVDTYSISTFSNCYTISGFLGAPYELSIPMYAPEDGVSGLCGSFSDQTMRFINENNELVDVSFNSAPSILIDEWVTGEENTDGPGTTDLYYASGSYTGSALITVYENPNSETIVNSYTSLISGEFVHALNE